MYQARAYSAASRTSPLAATNIPRREPTERDVQIKILFCGICHSDLHAVRDEWNEFMPTVYPIVPGHEIVGRVMNTGSAVTKHKPGDLVGVGCLVDSDQTCNQCKAGLEQFCPERILTYNSPDRHLGGVTYGGYADTIVVDEHFVLRVPSNLDLAGAAPLLCAGITTFNALRNSGARAGDLVAILGIGGLGHLAVQFARRMGFHTVAIAREKDKEKLALELGAHRYIDSQAQDVAKELQALGGAKLILATVANAQAMTAVINGLGIGGKLLVVGVSREPIEVTPIQLINGTKQLAGWPSGTSTDSEDTLRFSVLTGVKAMIETYPLAKAAEGYERMLSGKARFRVVLVP